VHQGEGWVPTEASKSLSGRASRDTKPEIALRRALHRRGLRFRVHTRIGDRLTLDIEFPAAKVAVFCDGCWWHGGCPEHPRTPARGPNRERWEAKFASIAEREQRAGRILEGRGYVVFRIKECRIAADAEAVAAAVEAMVQSRRRNRP
jgi:DNA mismatch endonuclease (patch repair protein)